MMKILKMGEVSAAEIFRRNTPTVNVTDTVAEILRQVRERGDAALREYTRKFDGADLENLLVTEAEMAEAVASVEPEFLRVLEKAAENIRKFHSRQIRNSFIINDEDGVIMGQKVIPVDRVGLYVPGGTAAYPSSVLMALVPAKIAGVPEVVITTPPGKNGKINPAILAAAKAGGADRIVKAGGAQAIAALAYGTESVPKVDKIVGPGNAFVAEAKRQVYGLVSIDMIAGPSEILVVADGKSNPHHLAADLLSQAEHDKNASAVLVTDSAELALQVQTEIEKQLPKLEREEIARASIENNGKIILTENLRSAIDTANEIAPEHLELCVDNPFDYLDAIRHAGSIFLGRNCPEALGDYLAGPNHTLPTQGTARFSSPLSVDDFVKKTQYTYFTRDALNRVAADVALFARKEGLTGHARSALSRGVDPAWAVFCQRKTGP